MTRLVVSQTVQLILRVIIEEKWSWKEHINVTANKISKSLGVLYRMKNTVFYYVSVIYYINIVLPSIL